MSLLDYLRAKPRIELYEFTCGQTQYLYASGTEPIAFAGKTYKPEFITRSDLSSSPDIAKDVLTITLHPDSKLAQDLFVGMPDNATRLVIYAGNYAGSYSQIWQGFITGVHFSYSNSSYVCELSLETIASRMERQGLVRNYQIACPLVLYSALCGANRSAARVTEKVAESSAYTLNMQNSYAANMFAGGEVTSQDMRIRRFIIQSSGRTITTDRPHSFKVGEAIHVTKGCDKTWKTCVERFNNGINYGGHRWIPLVDPFTSTIG